MPQAIALLLIGGVVWLAARAFRREMNRIGAQMQQGEAKTRAVTPLEKGVDGVYRPRKPE